MFFLLNYIEIYIINIYWYLLIQLNQGSTHLVLLLFLLLTDGTIILEYQSGIHQYNV